MSSPTRALLLSLGLMWCGVGLAQRGASAGPSKEKVAKILELMKVTHADKVGDSMLESFKNIMPPQQFDRLSRVVKSDDLINVLIPIYDKHFSDQDLDGLLVFYKTPLGQKVINEMPAVAQESSAVGMKYAQELLVQSAQEQKPSSAPQAK